jgi:5-methylcytosine-specific restriction enzyme A
MRKNFSDAVKVARFNLAGGKCETCGMDLRHRRKAFDHFDPDGMTGKPVLENCRLTCLPCHESKTKIDVARIAKAKRREARHIGVKDRKFGFGKREKPRDKPDKLPIPPRRLYQEIKK